MTKLLHPLPPSHTILARATASLEQQHLAISSIDVNKHPDLIKSKEDTLKYLDFEFEAINADIEFINQQVTKAFKFKAGGQKIAYPCYVRALEKCTELFIHMEHWAIWHSSKMAARRLANLKAKYSVNELICKNEIVKLEATLGRKLVGTDYLTWSRQLRKEHPNPPAPKAPRNQKHNGTPLKPIPGAPVLNTSSGWSDSTLRKIFEKLTGCRPTTKK